MILWMVCGGLAVSALFYAWPLFIIFAVLAAVVYGVNNLAVGVLEFLDYRIMSGVSYRRGMAARADEQHRQIMEGDVVRGTYGQFMPPEGLR